jgi:hypothetical protein
VEVMNITYAYSPYFTSTLDSDPPGRLIVGIVLHDRAVPILKPQMRDKKWNRAV